MYPSWEFNLRHLLEFAFEVEPLSALNVIGSMRVTTGQELHVAFDVVNQNTSRGVVLSLREVGLTNSKGDWGRVKLMMTSLPLRMYVSLQVWSIPNFQLLLVWHGL